MDQEHFTAPNSVPTTGAAVSPKTGKVALRDAVETTQPFAPTGETSAQDAEEGTIDWPAPLLFGEIRTPAIPVDILPTWLAKYVGGLSASTQTPPGMAVMLALAVVAVTVQGKFVVAPFGEADKYREPVNLWVVVPMPPASRKTAVLTALTLPLCEWERAQAERLAPEIDAQTASNKISERRIEELTKKAAKCDEPDERKRMAHEIALLKESAKEPLVAPRLFTGDVTPERLQAMLCEHSERMGVISDEGGIWDVMAGLYTDGRANLDVFLQSHAGSPVRVDRAGRTAYLRNPALTFGLCVQPAVVAELGQGAKRRFRGTGTLARFLWCLPESNIGSRDVTKRVSIPDEVCVRYSAEIYRLLNTTPRLDGDGRPAPHVISLTDGAFDCWIAFVKMVERDMADNGQLEALQDWAGKLPGAAARVAALLHLAEHGTSRALRIEEETMARALQLCELLIEHAKAAFELIGVDPAVDDARFLQRWLKRQGQLVANHRDMHRLGRFSKGKVERLNKALDLLIERHIISGRHSESTRKPRYTYRVNPQLFEA